MASLLALLPCPSWAQATADEPARKAFRVCQDPNNMPFSNVAGDGIENQVAQLFAKELGLPVTYYNFPQRMAFVRNTLRFKLPDTDYPCDIIMGVPVGFDQVSVTKPYYRSTYALVLRSGSGFDHVRSAEDFLASDAAALKRLRIGVYDRSPASLWLARHGLEDNGVPYKILDADPAQYPGQIIERDLARGEIDAAVVWGPIAGYFAQRVGDGRRLKVVPLRSERHVKLDYEMAMGVRHGERAWKERIEALIDAKRPEIQSILQSYGVPLVDAAPEAQR